MIDNITYNLKICSKESYHYGTPIYFNKSFLKVLFKSLKYIKWDCIRIEKYNKNRYIKQWQLKNKK